jgi:hypothetical protein
MQRKCCVCQKTQWGGEWLAMPVEIDGPITHGYCPECFSELMTEIQAVVAVHENDDSGAGGAVWWKSPCPQGGQCA